MSRFGWFRHGAPLQRTADSSRTYAGAPDRSSSIHSRIVSCRGSIFVAFCLICAMSAFGPRLGCCEEMQLKEVSFISHWIPQAQFAGYYMAAEKGFYRNVGLAVTLLNGGPEKPALDMLEQGQVTFCTEWLASAIKRRAAGARIVNVAQILPRSAVLLVCRKDAGIRRPADLAGRKVGAWPNDLRIPVQAFLEMNMVEARFVPNYTTVSIFLRGAVDAVEAMLYNEYHLILNSGFNPTDLQVFRLADLGVNFPEDGLYCREETFQADPQLCAAFAEASLRGWRYALEHEEETLSVVMKLADGANTGTNRAHQRWMLRRMRDLVLGGETASGTARLHQGSYEYVAQTMLALGFITRLPSYREFYRGMQ